MMGERVQVERSVAKEAAASTGRPQDQAKRSETALFHTVLHLSSGEIQLCCVLRRLMFCSKKSRWAMSALLEADQARWGSMKQLRTHLAS